MRQRVDAPVSLRRPATVADCRRWRAAVECDLAVADGIDRLPPAFADRSTT